jgi:hypothetical protein
MGVKRDRQEKNSRMLIWTEQVFLATEDFDSFINFFGQN